MADDKDLSGLDWFKRNHAKYPNSAKIADLDSGFKSNVKAFTDALKAAGAKVTVSATLRNPKRAALMHWAFKVAKGKVKAAAVPKIAGVRITWDHGDDSKSVAAAAEMVGKSGFNIAFQPSLTSRHIQGKAIDMTIDSAPTNGRNKELHKVGATYGVVKLVSDPPHWSTDGR
jgi:uncharacterized protein YcbK (DUF882 family)